MSQRMRRNLTLEKFKKAPRSAFSQGGDVDPHDSTASVRVWRMWDEALTFLDDLQKYENTLLDYEESTSGFMTDVLPLMKAPLPRVWDSVEGGLAEPIRATISHDHPHTAGGEMDTTAFIDNQEDFRKRLEYDILRPLDQWKDALVTVQERLPELLRLRDRVMRRMRKSDKEKERHGVATGKPTPKKGGITGLVDKCFSPRTADLEDSSDDEVETELKHEDANMRITYQQRKLDAIRASYEEQERLVYEQLSGLCRDAAWLKSYIASSLIISKEALQTVVVTMGPTKQPLPSFGVERAVVKEHGAVASNEALAAAGPKFLDVGPLRMRLTHAPSLHAHKGTAQPLELHARHDARPEDIVPAVNRGAAEIPVAMLTNRMDHLSTSPRGAMAPAGPHSPSLRRKPDFVLGPDNDLRMGADQRRGTPY